MNLLRILLGIVLPPLGVFLTFGFGSTFLINVALTIFGYVPGIIHAVWSIVKHEQAVDAADRQERVY